MRATSETILGRKNAVYILCAMLGPLALCAYRLIPADDSTLSTGYVGIALAFISRIEGILLPRSLMEFTGIEEVMGVRYFLCVAFLDAAISCLSLLAIVSTLSDAYYYPVDSFQHPTTIDLLPARRMWTSLLVVFGALFLSPAEFKHVSLYQNYVDPYGLYFVKASLFITAGYYHLNKLLINAFFSLFRVNRVLIPR